MKTTIFTESIDLTEATLDTTNRVLKDVVLIRVGESKNTTNYSAPVLEAAVPIFEGVSAYLDHPDPKNRKPRSLAEFTGVYRNVRFENNAIRGDRYFSNNQAGRDVMAIAEDVIAGHIPSSAVGLSINAAGKARKENGRLIVEAITAAESVDDVANPAAGGSYIESVQGDALAQALMEAMTYDEWVSARPDYVGRFEAEHKKVRWNGELKEAKAQNAEYAARVQALEADVSQLQESLSKANARALAAEKRVLVVDALASVHIPASWKKSLTEALLEADPDTWVGMIEREISKAKSAGHQPRVEGINVPGPQTTPPPQIATVESLAPRDDEDPIAWMKRVQAHQQRQGR
jgi:hypothetical protein